MHICVISTASLQTPPEGGRYAGMERVSNLVARGLEELGHEVAMIAKTGSHPSISGCVYGIEDEREIPDVVSRNKLDEWTRVFIDISHDKVLPRTRPELPVIENFQAMSMTGTGRNVVLISEGQWRGKFSQVQEAEIIYQPIDLNEMQFYAGPRDNYILYMGQRIPEKRIEFACELALATNIPLKVFGPGWGSPEYHALLGKYQDEHPNLISINSDIGGEERIHTIQHARALVHPVGANNWCEAGGIIVLEALACGTSCLVSSNGCLPEYIRNGVNGFVTDDIQEAANLLKSGAVDLINPLDCRQSAERFNYPLIAMQYEKLCKRVVAGERWNA